MVSPFREVKERVSALDAARHYGAKFNTRGWACCPFHDDRSPSMSFKNGRYHCWVCNLDGDAVDYVQRLFGLDAMGAVRRLNEDFQLGLELDRPQTQEERLAAMQRQKVNAAYEAFEEWRQSFLNALCAAFRAVRQIEPNSLEELTEGQAEAIRMLAPLEDWITVLISGTAEQQFQIYAERGELEPWIKRILQDCSTSSPTS